MGLEASSVSNIDQQIVIREGREMRIESLRG